MKAAIQRLFEHLYWADELAVVAVRDAGERASSSLALLAHVLGAEHVWLARLEGREPMLPPWPELSSLDCEQVARELRREYARFLEGEDDASLARTVRYVNSAGIPYESRVDDILIHVALHGSYHRGQVAFTLREEGARPNPTDYIAFVRGAPAATRA